MNSFGNGVCHYSLQLSAMDVLARTPMKGAAKCDKHSELQNSVNEQELERVLCFWDIPESMPASVSVFVYSSEESLYHLLRVLVSHDVHAFDDVFMRYLRDDALIINFSDKDCEVV